MDPWGNVGNTFRSWWPDADGLDVELLDTLLDAAKVQCRAYAPKDAPVTAATELAVCMQAQALYNSMSAGAGDSIGPEGQTIRVYPMDRAVKRLLRPQRGIPVVR